MKSNFGVSCARSQFSVFPLSRKIIDKFPIQQVTNKKKVLIVVDLIRAFAPRDITMDASLPVNQLTVEKRKKIAAIWKFVRNPHRFPRYPPRAGPKIAPKLNVALINVSARPTRKFPLAAVT